MIVLGSIGQGGKMYHSNSLSVQDVANNLEVSEALIIKFIKMGLIVPLNDGSTPKFTTYGMRQLRRIVDLYEKSYSHESIEYIINH